MSIAKRIKDSYKGGSKIKTEEEGVGYDSGLTELGYKVSSVVNRGAEKVRSRNIYGSNDISGTVVGGAGAVIAEAYIFNDALQNMSTGAAVGVTLLVGALGAISGGYAGSKIEERTDEWRENRAQGRSDKLGGRVEEVHEKYNALVKELKEGYTSLLGRKKDPRFSREDVRKIGEEITRACDRYAHENSNYLPTDIKVKRGGHLKLKKKAIGSYETK